MSFYGTARQVRVCLRWHNWFPLRHQRPLPSSSSPLASCNLVLPVLESKQKRVREGEEACVRAHNERRQGRLNCLPVRVLRVSFPLPVHDLHTLTGVPNRLQDACRWCWWIPTKRFFESTSRRIFADCLQSQSSRASLIPCRAGLWGKSKLSLLPAPAKDGLIMKVCEVKLNLILSQSRWFCKWILARLASSVHGTVCSGNFN